MGSGWEPQKGAAGGRGSKRWTRSAKAPENQGSLSLGLICWESLALPSWLKIINGSTCPLESLFLTRRRMRKQMIVSHDPTPRHPLSLCGLVAPCNLSSL